MPKYHNDYMFMRGLDQWFLQNGAEIPDEGVNIFKVGIPWDTIRETYHIQYLEDNARLSNILATLFLLLPKWLASGMMAILWLWSAVLGMKLIGIDINRSPLVVVSLVGWTFLLPWSNHFGCLDVQFNYVLPTFLCILLFSLLKERRDHRETVAYVVFIGLLALLTGFMHEGFSASMFVGLSVLFVVYRRWRTPSVLVALVALLIGCLWLLSVPGARSRSARELDLMRLLEPGMLKYLFQTYCKGLIAVLILLLPAVVPKLRKRLCAVRRDSLVFCGAAAIAAMGVCFLSGVAPRGYFWMDYVSVLLAAGLLNAYFPAYFAQYHLSSSLVAVPLMIFTLVHIGYVDYAAFRYRNVLHSAFKSFRENKESFVFCSDDYILRPAFLCGDRPDINFSQIAVFDFPIYFVIPDMKVCPVLIPSALRDVDATSGAVVPGDSGLRVKEGFLFIDYERFKEYSVPEKRSAMIELDFGKGYRGAKAFAATFRSERDGKLYVWIKPEIVWYLDRVKTLRRARLRPDFED